VWRCRPRALSLQEPFERFEEPARPAGEIGARLVARPLPGQSIDREADARLVVGQRQPYTAEGQCRHHRLVGRRELAEKTVNRLSEQLCPAGIERFLIDDEDEAPAGVDAGIRAVRSWHSRRCTERSLERTGRDAAQRAHGADPVADPDLDFTGLELCDRCAVGLDGDEVDDRACESFGRHLRALGTHARRWIAGGGRQNEDEERDPAVWRGEGLQFPVARIESSNE